MTHGWDPENQGILVLPSGRLVRARALRKPIPDGPSPDFGLYLLGHQPDPTPWPYRWLRWPDLRLPFDPAAARDALIEVWERAADQRVEVACGGGRGRTGTALACLAVLDAWRPRELSPTFDSTSTTEPWRRRGSHGTSLGSTGGSAVLSRTPPRREMPWN